MNYGNGTVINYTLILKQNTVVPPGSTRSSILTKVEDRLPTKLKESIMGMVPDLSIPDDCNAQDIIIWIIAVLLFLLVIAGASFFYCKKKRMKSNTVVNVFHANAVPTKGCSGTQV